MNSVRLNYSFSFSTQNVLGCCAELAAAMSGRTVQLFGLPADTTEVTSLCHCIVVDYHTTSSTTTFLQR